MCAAEPPPAAWWHGIVASLRLASARSLAGRLGRPGVQGSCPSRGSLVRRSHRRRPSCLPAKVPQPAVATIRRLNLRLGWSRLLLGIPGPASPLPSCAYPSPRLPELSPSSPRAPGSGTGTRFCHLPSSPHFLLRARDPSHPTDSSPSRQTEQERVARASSEEVRPQPACPVSRLGSRSHLESPWRPSTLCPRHGPATSSLKPSLLHPPPRCPSPISPLPGWWTI